MWLSKKLNMLLNTLRLRNDLYCVKWGVKLYSLTTEYISEQQTHINKNRNEKNGIHK